jgi:hypothetical protein
MSQQGYIKLQGLTYTVNEMGQQYAYTLTPEYVNVAKWDILILQID